MLKQPDHQFSIPRRGRSGTRPGILNRAEIERLLAAPRNLKHRALLALPERILRTTGVDITLCPHCGKGHIHKTTKIIPKGQSP